MGNETYVKCAEDQRRYGECSSLKICILQDTTGHDVILQHFPSDFILITSSHVENIQMIRAGRCNVLSEVRSGLNYLAYSNVESKDLGFVVGAKTLSKEPLAIVTRQNDREFSDIINWVMQALFFGEEQALQTIHHFAKIIQPPLDFKHLT
jgi:general L-amino acid transport system substrate-binding protein